MRWLPLPVAGGLLLLATISHGQDDGQDEPATNSTPAAGPIRPAATAAGQVSVAPNPARGSFTLTLPALGSQRVAQATLLNVLGQAVATRTIALTAAGATAEFDTHALAPGMYVLRLVAGAETVTQRMAVE